VRQRKKFTRFTFLETSREYQGCRPHFPGYLNFIQTGFNGFKKGKIFFYDGGDYSVDYIRYVIATVFGLTGLWLFILNWKVFWNSLVKRKTTASWIPLLAGCLLCVAFLIFPFNSNRWLCWLAFVIDWGSLPGISFSIWHGISRSHLS
jgi:hypothetical protein